MRLGGGALVVVMLAVAVPAPAQELFDRIRINGYTSLEFEKQLSAEGGGDPNGSFDADLFDLVFNIQASERIRVAADVTWEHGAASEDDRGNVALEYGFVEYAVSDLIKFRAGKMFVPFGIFNEIHTAKPAFLSVKEAASTNRPDRILDEAYRFYPRWEAGIALHGDGVVGGKNLSYDVMLANGDNDETNPFEEDNNSAKSFTARVRFEPGESLRLAYSFYYDQPGDADRDRLRSHGLELEWTWKALGVWSEVVFGSQRSRADGRWLDQIGFYVQPSWRFAFGLTPYLRFDLVDPDTSASANRGFDLVVGLNYEVSQGFMLKLENNRVWGEAGSSLAQYPGRRYDELKAAVVLGF